MRNEVLDDLVRSFPNYSPQMIFDVGANTGQSASELQDIFPQAALHSFEPIGKSFEALVGNCGAKDGFRAHNMALGSRSGSAVMRSTGTSTANRLIIGASGSGENTETVKIEAGDDFCLKEGISHIDILKIDAEGHDMEVIRGFMGMLCSSQIDLVQVECSLSPANKQHVAFEHFKVLFEALNYRLFGLFSQKRHRRDPFSAIFGDAVFASPLLMEKHRPATAS